jgi:hypothetical protein
MRCDRLQPLLRTPDRKRVRIHANNAARHRSQTLGQQSFTTTRIQDTAAVPRRDADQPGVVGGVVVPVIIHGPPSLPHSTINSAQRLYA